MIATVAGAELRSVARRYARLSAAVCAHDDTDTDKDFDLVSATNGVVAYCAPGDATRTGLASGEIDVVFSSSVLEHVPPGVITALHRESRRVLVPGGVFFHSVNCGDHYAYVDPGIGQLHYLRYSDREWALWNNAFLYQNRLRAHELVEAAAIAGFDIILDTAKARPERLRELATIPVHAQFSRIPPEKLCITTVDFLARSRAVSHTDVAFTRR